MFYTILLLGKATVGKTSLIFRFANNICPIEHDPTIEESYTIEISIEKGETRQFKILDTGENGINKTILDEWICNSNGFLLIFAINDSGSFEDIKNYVERIKQNSQDKLPIILVGNKSDLANERQISKQAAQEYAKEIGASYYETSALIDENGSCKLIFEECASKIIKNATFDEGGDTKCTKCSLF